MQKFESEKILPLSQLSHISQKLKKQGKKIVLCHGAFDLIHPGHIRHFKTAKSYGDILIVTITADRFINKGPGRPIFNELLRSEVLAAIECIDYVGVSHSASAIAVIKKIKPDIYVKGPDYKHRKPNPKIPRKLGAEEAAVKALGGELKFTDDEIVFSSTSLINTYIDTFPPKTKDYIEAFKQKYTSEGIIEKLLELKKLKILIIGDTIIDQYHYIRPMGKSYKEPIIVHRYESEESFIGGVLATANHTAALVDRISLATILGKKKSFKPFILKKLRPLIKPKFFYNQDANTVIKRRFIDGFANQKLFQIAYMKDELIIESEEKEILKFLNREIKSYDLVMVNDFGQGMFTQKIIDVLCAKAKYLGLNVQANSTNYGFNVITKFPKADFVCIDEQEIRLATHDKYRNLPTLIQVLYKQMNCHEMIITRGADGSLTYSKTDNRLYETPAFTQKAVDRIGAGDALFAVSVPSAFIGMEKDLVAFIGNVAGALQVQTVGNRDQITFLDLTKFITRLLK